MKKTKWITGVEPVCKGVYQRLYTFGIYFAHFDGIDWGPACDTVQDAHRWAQAKLRTYSGLPWRGLVTKGGGS